MINFPYPDMQQLNLDWVLNRLKAIMRFIPSGGAVGQILRRTSTGAEWSNESAGAVSSVNGQTGTVVLDASDVGALPDSYTPPATPEINLVHFGICATGAADEVKEVSIPTVTALTVGLVVNVKFTIANTHTSPKLKINNLAAVPMYQYGTTAMAGSATTTGYNAGAIVQLTYDGTGFVRDQGYNTNTTYTTTNIYCITSASTAAKVGTGQYFALPASPNTRDQLFEITFRYTNTKASALTLNVNSTGAKPLWINGAPSSSTNYKLPASHYICRYNSTDDRYELWINAKITCDIEGTASGNYSPSNLPWEKEVVSNNASVTFNIANAQKGVVLIGSYYAAGRTIVSYGCSNTGVVKAGLLEAATGITFDDSVPNELSITNSSGATIVMINIY